MSRRAGRVVATEAEQALLAAAREVARRAHAPYSGCRVGCALRTRRGVVYAACNVENASHGLTTCAERNAVAAAVAAEGPAMRLAEVAVVVLGRGLYFPPCGACRQVLAEFSGTGGPVAVIYPVAGGLERTTVAALLPGAFGRESLGGAAGRVKRRGAAGG